MRLGRILIIAAIVLILVLAAIYAVTQLSPGSGASSDDAEMATTDIVILVQPIDRGGVLTAEMLDYLAFPTGETIEGMFTNFDDIVGLQARYDLEPGIPMTSAMLVGGPDDLSTVGSDQALLIPAGMVAFPITIDRFSSLGYGLRAGDHVNVIATMLFIDIDQDFQSALPNNTGAIVSPGGSVVLNSTDGESNSSQVVSDDLLSVLSAQVASGGAGSPQGNSIVDPVFNQPFYVVPSEAQRPRLVSQTLMQDVVILHIGNSVYTDEFGEEVADAFAPQSPGLDGSGQQLPAPPKSPPDLITLIVTPQDAVTLNYLLFSGAKLTMALRSGRDANLESTQAVTLEYLVNSYDIPVPSKLPFGLDPSVQTLQSPTFSADNPLLND
jgi:pilus assembly protein CpaB